MLSGAGQRALGGVLLIDAVAHALAQLVAIAREGGVVDGRPIEREVLLHDALDQPLVVEVPALEGLRVAQPTDAIAARRLARDARDEAVLMSW